MSNAPLIQEAASAFPFGSSVRSATPFGGGHINDTFLVETGNGAFVLQRLNKYVFPRPDWIMENISRVTRFLAQKLASLGLDPARGTLTLVGTQDGRDFYIDSDGHYWRATASIENTTAYESATSAAMFEKAGAAFGQFQSMLSDYPADTLHEIIPNFHNTPDRYRQLMDAVEKNAAGRLSEVQAELAFVEARRDDCAALMALLQDGRLPLKVTHNDTKMSNVLIDNGTQDVVCVIDLDTVMPGLAAFDFGDSIRAGASTGAEDEADLTKVHFSLPLFEAYTKGFLGAAGDALTPLETETLPLGAKLMTLEVGMRFLADYLNGDVYFKTSRPGHNLDRARNQLHLVADMERQWDGMTGIIGAYL